MSIRHISYAVAFVFAFLFLGATPASATLTDQQRAQIDQITGAKGAYTAAEDTHKVSFPRTDVKVTVDGWPMQPFMGITSWAAFTAAPDGGAVVMGDLTLFQDEVNPVMSALLDAGLEVTAIHNHFFYDDPRVFFMHIGGHGGVEQLATGVRKALDTAQKIRAAAPAPASGFGGPAIPAQSSITPAPLEEIFKAKGQASGGMEKFMFGRTAQMHGATLGNQMGVNTWAAFAGSDDNAFVDGDFVVLASELQTVLKTLRQGGINIVAIHSHMAGEEPRYIFLHYWGKSKAAELARAVQAALATQSK
jgi:uncharacterized protein DUF1259